MNNLSTIWKSVLVSVLLMPMHGSAAIDVYDSLMVRQILDEAGWRTVPVDSVVPGLSAGITATGRDRVTSLNLNYRNSLAPAPLTRLPEQIGQLPELVSLSLAGNSLFELPMSLSTLYHLGRLDLTSNRFTRLPEALRGGAVRNLVVSHNLIDTLPDWIDSLPQLQSLVLVGNGISALPAAIAKLANLSTLNLDSNRLASLPAELSLLTSLRVGVAGNRLCDVGDTLATWLDKYHLAADWRTTQNCELEIAAVVTDAITGTVVNFTDNSQKLLSSCRPVQLSAAAAADVVRPELKQVLKAVEVRFEECFSAADNYFTITIPWSDVAGRFENGGLLSLYLVRGTVAEYLGGTVDSVKKTIAVRSNREGIYLLTVTGSATGVTSSDAYRTTSASPRIRLRGGSIETTVSLVRPSLLRLRLLTLDGKILLTSLRHLPSGTTACRIDGISPQHGTYVAEILCNGFRCRRIVQQY